MIDAKQARANMATLDEREEKQLKSIYSKIELQSKSSVINWISVPDLSENNKETLESKGFDVWQSTFGADKGEWKIKW